MFAGLMRYDEIWFGCIFPLLRKIYKKKVTKKVNAQNLLIFQLLAQKVIKTHRHVLDLSFIS